MVAFTIMAHDVFSMVNTMMKKVGDAIHCCPKKQLDQPPTHLVANKLWTVAIHVRQETLEKGLKALPVWWWNAVPLLGSAIVQKVDAVQVHVLCMPADDMCCHNCENAPICWPSSTSIIVPCKD